MTRAIDVVRTYEVIVRIAKIDGAEFNPLDNINLSIKPVDIMWSRNIVEQRNQQQSFINNNLSISPHRWITHARTYPHSFVLIRRIARAFAVADDDDENAF